MKRHGVFAIAFATLFISTIQIRAATFDFATGNHSWNVATNWTPDDVPDTAAESAFLPGPDAPAADLSISLDSPVTIGTLDVSKSTSPNSGNTFIIGANTLSFDGTPTLVNHNGTGIGTTVIDVPVQLNAALTVDQESDQQLRFIEPISGAGNLTIRRAGTGNGGRTVVLGAANTYTGTQTTFTSIAGADNWLIVRLNDPNALPATTNVALGNSTVLEIASGNFTRAAGTAAGQINFTGSGRNGFAAFDADRTVDLGGPITWGGGAGQVNFSQLVLGLPTANAMVTLINPIAVPANRNLRIYNGTAPIDGRISGDITGTGMLTKLEPGALSFSGNNSYSGGTRVEQGIFRLDSPTALPTTGILTIGKGSTLGIGADTTPGDPNSDFAKNLGTNSGDMQMIAIVDTANNQANAGLSAHGGNRTVVFNGGAQLLWGANFFLSGTMGGTPSRNLILSDETADGTLILRNPIDLNGADRTVVPRNGSADIDAELSGVISGTGGLIQDNTGTLALTNANTYSGNTTILRGRLLANNTTGSATSGGTVTVDLNATLAGTGSVAGVVTVNSGGHIAAGSPGTSIESLQLGGLTIETGSILDFDLGTPNGIPGINNDLLNVTGTTTLNGIGAVNLTNAGGLGAGSYTLIDYAGALAGSDIAGFLGQTPTGPGPFSYSLVDTGTTIDLTVSMPFPNDADFNDDAFIDAADYVVWRKFNPATGTGTARTGDANGDGDVNDLDYDEWYENFASPIPPGGGGSQGVPEPSAIVLLLLAVPLFGFRTRL